MCPVTPSTPGSGTRFSERYEIKNQAGMGGMGTVYQAIDRDSGNLIALKILHSRSTIEQARFDQEARVLSELSHPGIVHYFDHGVTPNGSPYIAMEWLEGETLEDRLGRGNLGPAAAAHLARLVLEALSAAHARNIVHRDIKPGNIFLVGWKLSEIRVLDFGIARRVFDDKRLTRKGSTVGTPLYTSPEQARGRADVDGRADIFSLGCVLFELLTGEPPFTGETPLEVMTKVCAGRVPELRSRRPGIPMVVSSLVHGMLSPDPVHRPQSAAALAVEFAEVVKVLGGITGESAAASLPSRATRASISESEDHLASAILVSLGKREPESTPGLLSSTEERRRGPKAASIFPSIAERPGKSAEDTRLAEIRRLLEAYACEMDRLLNRTLLLTAPTVSSAQEQAIQLASAALALHDLQPDAKIAIATGRASFLGRLPVGRLMDCLPVLMEGQEAGTIRLDDTTRRLLPARFATGGEPGSWFLLDEGNSLTEERSRESEGRVSPFLGREREIASLQSLLEETRDEKAPRAVLLLGPPGQGKSRLLREFLTANPDASLQVALASGTLLRIERRYPALASMLVAAGIDVQGKSSQHVEEALAAWIESRCTPSGFLLVVEDLQWADTPSLELLDRLMHRLHDKPLMVIGVGRDEVEDRFPGLWSARSARRLRLRPLSPKQGLTLLHFWIPSVSRTAADFMLDRWEGNPQFLEEMAAHAADRGTLAIPAVVHAVGEGRLEGVEPDVRRVLRAASLFGDKPFCVDALISLLGESARKGIAEWLEVLVMRDFIERDIRAGEASYRFRERLLRDAAYQMLTSADRVLGRRLARAWLEGAGRTLPECLACPTVHRSAAGG